MSLESLIEAARASAAKRHHGRAVATWLQVLQRRPELQPELEEEVCAEALAYCEQLCAQGQGAQASWLVQQMAGVLKPTAGIFQLLGSVNFLLHKPMDAIVCFDKALALAPRLWTAREALENLKSMACDRWHYRMLNDVQRNAAYAQALEQCAKGARVLDIGTGTGILSLLAVRAGAAEVTACDTSPVMCRLAEHCIRANSGASKESGPLFAAHELIHVVHESSDALCARLPHAQYDVIVTELVDSGLLGEHILPALRAARRCLAPGGTMLPRRAHVFAQLIQCPHLRRRAALSLDESGCLHGVSLGPVRVLLEEPYTCEPLYNLPHTPLTDPVRAHTVDFHSDEGEVVQSISTLQLPVIAAGRVDAVAMWFNMDVDEAGTCVVSTSPLRGAQCGWDQGLFFLSNRHAEGDAVMGDRVSGSGGGGGDDIDDGAGEAKGNAASHAMVSRGEQVRLAVTHGDHGLHFAVSHPAWSLSSTPLSSGPDSRADDVSGSVVRVGEQDMARLNDESFHMLTTLAVADAITNTVAGSVSGVGEGDGDGRDGEHKRLAAETTATRGARILCIEDGWSVRPLLYASLPGVTSVTCVQPLPAAARALAMAAAALESCQFDVVHSLEVLLAGPADESESAMAADPADEHEGGLTEENNHRQRGFDVVVVDVCDGSGLLVPRMLQTLGAAAVLAGPAARVLPSRVVVQCVPIESDWLCAQNRVAPASSLGINVDAINAFGATRYCDLDASQFPHRRLAQATPLHALDIAAAARDSTALAQVAAITVTLEEAGRIDAVLVWYELSAGPTSLLSTITNTPSNHFRQCAMMVPGPMLGAAGSCLAVRAEISAEYGLHVECQLVE